MLKLDDYITSEKASELLHITKMTMQARLRAGTAVGAKINGKWYVAKSYVEAIIATAEQTTATAETLIEQELAKQERIRQKRAETMRANRRQRTTNTAETARVKQYLIYLQTCILEYLTDRLTKQELCEYLIGANLELNEKLNEK